MVKGGVSEGYELGEPGGDDFDVAGGEMGVLGGALGNGAVNLHDVFAAKVVCGLAERGVIFNVEHNLRYAISVAEVYERHAAHFADALHPTGEGHFLTDVSNAEFSASVSPVHYLHVFLVRFQPTKLRKNPRTSKHKKTLRPRRAQRSI